MADHKYDLRYEDVWWFTAGLLKYYPTGLTYFFKNLLAQPRDISESYELLLWIKCLEECELKLETKQQQSLLAKIVIRARLLLTPNKRLTELPYANLWWDTLSSSPQVSEALPLYVTKNKGFFYSWLNKEVVMIKKCNLKSININRKFLLQ